MCCRPRTPGTVLQVNVGDVGGGPGDGGAASDIRDDAYTLADRLLVAGGGGGGGLDGLGYCNGEFGGCVAAGGAGGDAGSPGGAGASAVGTCFETLSGAGGGGAGTATMGGAGGAGNTSGASCGGNTTPPNGAAGSEGGGGTGGNSVGGSGGGGGGGYYGGGGGAETHGTPTMTTRPSAAGAAVPAIPVTRPARRSMTIRQARRRAGTAR
jgi:hypothetical protein